METEWHQYNLQTLQDEPYPLWEPANIIQIQINDWRNATFPLKIVEVDTTTMYDTGANISCMLYACYIWQKNPQPVWNVPAMSVHSPTGHDLCPVGLMWCGNMVENLQFSYTFSVFKNLEEELIVGLDMQQLYWLGHD